MNELITIKCPNLGHLILNENIVEKLEGYEGCEALKILELRGNRLSTTA